MTLSYHDLGLRPSQWKAVEKKARVMGASPSEYLRLLVERDLLADRSFDEIARPIREDVRAAKITEGQLEEIVERARRSNRRRLRKGR